MRNKRSILLVLSQASAGVGGAETLTLHIVKALRPYFQFHITYKGGPLSDKYLSAGVKLAPIQVNGKFDFLSAIRIGQYVRENRINIIHSQQVANDFYSAWVAFFLRVPLCITRHADISWFCEVGPLKRVLYECFDSFSVLVAKRIVCVSAAGKATFLGRYKQCKNKFLAIYNGINIDEFPAKRSNGPVKVIGMVAQMTAAKDYSTFLKACKAVSIIYPDIKFWLIGDGPDRRALEDRAKSLGIFDSCVFYGYQSNIPLLLKNMDLFVLSSNREGFPMVILEAMSTAIPVVASDVGGVKEIVSGRNGLLVEPGNCDALTTAMLTIIHDDAFRCQLSANARDTVVNGYNITNVAKRYLGLYNSLY